MFRIHQQEIEPTTLGVFARIVPESELIHIPLQMLLRGEMVDTDNTPFENRPKALYRVGVDIPTHILARAVVHHIVLEQLFDGVVPPPFVGVDKSVLDEL